jgi:flavin-dependent dehydrogenase
LTPRAVGVLDDMGLLDDLLQLGRRINRFEVIAPNRKRTHAPLPESPNLPRMALVVPRLILDDHIRQRALASGAHFESGCHVTGIDGPDASGWVTVQVERVGKTESVQARAAVIATGANSKLLLDMGILKQMPDTLVAARAYYEGVKGIDDVWQLRFDGVPLPGYGWIFPTGDGTANIGAGYFALKRKTSAAQTFHAFVANPALQPMLAGARMTGPMKGYPLRCDFTTAPTHAPGVLLVGEAAGLVNPLTGEGIDYALESGRIAAGQLLHALDGEGLSTERRAGYDAALRVHYQSLFEFCMLVRDRMCSRAWLMNLLVSVANRRERLRGKLALVVLGGRAIQGKLTLGRMLRSALR